jgi:hypothetical protein
MKTVTVAFLAATLATTTLLAQEPQPRPSPKPTADKAAPAAEARPEKVSRQPGQLANIRIDVRIVDERGGQPAMTKTVSLTVADRRNGFIRSNAEARFGATAGNLQSIPLHVDANPEIEGSHIRLALGIEYNFVDTTPAGGEAKQYPKLEIKQRLNLVLDDGKMMRVAQSADPLSDRRVSLELTATVLR